MVSLRKFLVIDSNSENGALLVRSLARKFPDAGIRLCPESQDVLDALATDAIDAVVLRGADADEAARLIEAIRRADAKVPIVAVSSVDRGATLLKAGATTFLPSDEWLRLGAVVQAALETREASVSAPPIAR